MANPSKPAVISDIDIALIDVVAGRRKLDPAWVETLSDLFASQGQQSPIELIARGERYQLVFGAHRLAAGQRLGWAKIAAVVKQPEDFANEAEITLREITENMARRQLSVLDKAVDIARWRDAYSAAHVVSKGGRKKAAAGDEELTAKFAESFTVASQKAFGLSERAVTYAIKIATIPFAIRDRIALHAIADNQSELLQLAAEPPERQAQIVALLTAEPAQAESVADAIALIDRLPKPNKPAGWERLSEAFSRMKERDQDRFFTLHEAAIQRWLAERG